MFKAVIDTKGVKDYVRSLAKKVADNQVVSQAATDLLEDMKYRIFVAGEGSDQSKIGRYLSQEYIAQRQRRNLQTSYVDLTYTGRLYNSITQKQTSTGVDIIVINNQEELVKNIENRYGRIFTQTKEEQDQLTKTIADKITKLLK